MKMKNQCVWRNVRWGFDIVGEAGLYEKNDDYIQLSLPRDIVFIELDTASELQQRIEKLDAAAEKAKKAFNEELKTIAEERLKAREEFDRLHDSYNPQ